MGAAARYASRVSPHTFLCTFLAPVPVGHRVAVEYHEEDVGTFGKKLQIDGRWFVVIDRDTGIRWGSQYTWSRDPPFRPNPSRRVAQRWEGVVQSCDVSSHMGSESQDIWTQLVVDVQRRAEA